MNKSTPTSDAKVAALRFFPSFSATTPGHCALRTRCRRRVSTCELSGPLQFRQIPLVYVFPSRSTWICRPYLSCSNAWLCSSRKRKHSGEDLYHRNRHGDRKDSLLRGVDRCDRWLLLEACPRSFR